MEVTDSNSNRFFVRQLNNHWSTCVANQDIAKGEIIGKTMGTFSPQPTRFTVQVARDLHLDFQEGFQFLNHSCEPNCRLIMSAETPMLVLKAIRDISNGEELTFDYATTEWDMEEKFQCQCNKPSCRGPVGGAKYLTPEQVKVCEENFTPAIKELMRDHMQQHQPQ